MMEYSYDAVTEILNKIPQYVEGYGVDRCRLMLERLQREWKISYRIIHIAGSNGKGSVSAYIEGILRANGYKTGLFTSPHLVTERERIRINNVPADEKLFVESFIIIQEIEKELKAEGKINRFGYFDYFFGMSIIAFQRAEIDIMVCETGLGGRLDSTNAADKVMASVITTISLEHTAVLGDTVKKIAEEKAGIIRKDTPVIFFDDNAEAAEVITARAENLGSPATGTGMKDVTITKTGANNIDFLLYNDYYKDDCFSVKTKALYQTENATLALVTLAVLERAGELKLDADKTKQAVCQVVWEGRMEEVQEGIYVDGAHNPEGIEAFVKSVVYNKQKNAVLLFSVVRDKNFETMIRILCESRAFEAIVVTVIDNDRRLEGEQIKKTFDKYTDREVLVEQNIEEAYKCGCSLKKKYEADMYCAGSLYLVGDIKRLLKGSSE